MKYKERKRKKFVRQNKNMKKVIENDYQKIVLRIIKMMLLIRNYHFVSSDYTSERTKTIRVHKNLLTFTILADFDDLNML